MWNNPKQFNKSGFSLTELTIVLLVFSVLLSVFVFGYSRFLKSTAVETASKDVVATLNLAREMSIAVNSTHRVHFLLKDSQAGNRQSYWIDRLSYDTAGNPVWLLEVTNVHFLPDQAMITDISNSTTSQAYIQFEPTGTSEAVTIHLINRSDDTTVNDNYYTIQVYASTARAKITPYSRY
jgi:prepilin-type N-terminal cleavage/methylation domain-containing protein